MSLLKLKQITSQSENNVQHLITKLNLLKKIYEQKANAEEKLQMREIVESNEKLREEIEKLKFDLNYIKVQNGARSISLPKTTAATMHGKESQEPAKIEKLAKKKKEVEKNVAKTSTKATAKELSAEEKPIDVSRLDMRIGKIIDVEKHPDADSLYVEKVDLGEEKPRTIVSGLVKFVKIEEMQNRIAIFMCNLKPAKMRGILSEGMIMCASTPEAVQPLNPPSNAEIGDRIVCNGFQGQPDKQLNPKRKIWEQVQPDLVVDSQGVAVYKGSPLEVEGKGICKAKSLKNCPIK